MTNNNRSLDSLPVIDISELITGSPGRAAVAQRIGEACRLHGFFYIIGHGVDAMLIKEIEILSRRFFSLSVTTKQQWRMTFGGSAWRGYFPLGDELTSGRPDWKEGLYLGTELPAEHPLVKARTPLHGSNLFPDVPGLREAILAYMAALTKLGHSLMEGIALSLALPANYFSTHYTTDPLILFRLFNYPSQLGYEAMGAQWGVGEHSDYGLLTILLQDDVGGLEIKTSAGWIQAPPIPGTFVCNIGDMLDFITGGLYRSTPHRVSLNRSGHDRLSLPFFFDPNFFSRLQPIENLPRPSAIEMSTCRWDGKNIHAFQGSYGEYLLHKIGKVFPELRQQVL